ncbi:ABC transporter substrate-binding protein [Phytoactinopolyspora limicola]|uniref:ABC transporter substrate-binding protein n=1 Tax=Phytoactinopolyspora limicola TaxID=2715536 RepID=UPI00140DC45D|nr:sugar ABC transporter substrate-binding protein [Phytoactinopolyspora limicola]
MKGSTSYTRRATAVLAAIAVAAVAACSGSSSGPSDGSSKARIVWTTWGSAEDLQRFEDFNDEFMERHPDIEVVLQAVPSYGEYHPKLLAQLISGTAPDVFYLGDDNVGTFVDAGVLTPLDDLMNSSDSKATHDDFFDGLFGAAIEGGVTYGVPTDSNPDVLWYSKTALEAAGITDDPADLAARGEWTVDTFLDMMDALRDADMIGAIFWNYWATHYSWVSAYGGTAYDEQGRFVLADDETSVEALRVLGERFQDGSFRVADTMPEGAGASTSFVSHQAGFFVQGRYTIGTIRQAGEEEQFDIAPWPSVDGEPKPVGVAAAYLAINEATDHPEAAWTFFEEFVSAEGQEFRLSGGGNAVPSILGADDVVLDGYPEHAETFLQLRDNGFANYASEARVPGLSDDISAAMLRHYEGRVDLDETLATIVDLVENADMPDPADLADPEELDEAESTNGEDENDDDPDGEPSP